MCKATHDSRELCPFIKVQLKKNPELLSEATNFANVAGQYHLVTSQSLDSVAQKVNEIIGSNLRIEGTQQFVRDIQVFNRLNTEAYKNIGVFRSPEAAKVYLENATKGQLNGLKAKIVGSAQEVDWLREKQGELRSIVERSSLFNNNAPGVDGEIINRFTDEKITRVTIKSASTIRGIKTGSDGIIKALEKGTLKPDDTAYVTKGMKSRLLNDLEQRIQNAKLEGNDVLADTLTKAKENLKIIENESIEKVADGKDRILNKIKDGNANTSITASDALNKAAKGAIIGAAIGLTISGITNYIRYRNGEIAREEAFINIGQEGTKSALIGGAMGTITLFLPAGIIGFVAGFAIGIYLNASLVNTLDEVFGKGAYYEILVASGCVMGTSINLAEAVKVFTEDRKAVQTSLNRTVALQAQTDAELKKINKYWR
jgi:hypothetical protein